ncbi:MAG: serine/threonine-protein kinase [Acidobacteriota bacterium]|jgi:serine/threonine protein kinase|nr:serine/threonine-protein kinase [Acidobacteriota bacterium]
MEGIDKHTNPTEINWQTVKQVFAGAMILKPENRSQYIYQQCGGNKTIVNEVESLLSSYDSASLFLESPAVAVVADELVKDSLELSSGKFLKHYQIIRKIGEGGMGAVYLARDTQLDRDVAIKILNQPFNKDKSNNIKRFLREAKAASGMNHPNIMVVHEVGTFEDINYIVCEFIEGETLNVYIEKNNSNLLRILDLSIQVINALATAHRVGIIHRDIKPDNIMVRNDGLVKILDFGLAKLSQKEKSRIDFDAQTQEILNTQKGLILGTVSYMSPEQSRGKEVDTRTDIWSFGVILYQMLTKKLPFSGETLSDNLAAILKDDPPPISELTANVPAELEEIVSKCLQKSAGQRYQNAQTLQNDLKNVHHKLALESYNEPLTLLSDKISADEKKTDYNLKQITDQQTENGFNKSSGFVTSTFGAAAAYSNNFPLALIASAMLAAVAYFGFSYLRPAANHSNAVPNLEFTKLTDERLTVMQSAISPDGKLLTYVYEKQGKQSLRVRQVAGSGVSEILPPAEVDFTDVKFSPDGDYIYYTVVKADNIFAVYKISALGGQSRLMAEGVNQRSTKVSPNGKSIVSSQHGTSIIFADIDGENQRVLAKAASGEYWYDLAWHPDGESIVGAVRSQTDDNFYLINVSLNDGSKTKIKSPPWYYINSLAWLSDGSGIIINGKEKPGQPLQIWSLSYPDGDIRRITNDTNDYLGLSLTADNKSLVTGKQERAMNIWVAGNKYKQPGQQITFSKGKNDGALGVRWTSEGEILYTTGGMEEADIWSVRMDGSDIHQLTSEKLNGIFPQTTPDGRYIVFLSEQEGFRNIWRMNVDGTNPVQLTDTPGREFSPNITPDGKWIIYDRSDLNNKVSIWKISVSGGESVRLIESIARLPVVSPDGKSFACILSSGDEKDISRIAVYPIDGGKPLKILDLPLIVKSRIFRWSADGNALIYVDKRDGADNLWEQPLNGKPPEQLTEFDSEDIVYFDISKDERNFLLSRGKEFFDIVRINNIR